MKISQLPGLLWLVGSTVRLTNPSLSNTGIEDIVLLAKVMDSLMPSVKTKVSLSFETLLLRVPVKHSLQVQAVACGK